VWNTKGNRLENNKFHDSDSDVSDMTGMTGVTGSQLDKFCDPEYPDVVTR